MGFIGDMNDYFILAAWPGGKGGAMASFRQATDKDSLPRDDWALQRPPHRPGRRCQLHHLASCIPSCARTAST